MSNTDRYANLLNLCVSELESCVSYVQKHSQNVQDDCVVLRDIAKQYCETDMLHKKSRQAQEATNQYFDNQENDCTDDVQEVYKKHLAELPNTNSFETHPIWCTINNAITGQKVSDVQINQEDELDYDDNQSIDEGILLSQFEPPVDPITKKTILDPCKNTKCGHIYEFSTITDFLKGFKERKSKPRCPHIGCSNANMKEIVKDKMLKEQIQNYLAENLNHPNSTYDENASTSSNYVLDRSIEIE